MVRQRVLTLLDRTASTGRMQWKRTDLRKETLVTLGDMLRTAATLHCDTGKDRLSASATLRIARAIKDRSTEDRAFSLAGVPITVTSRMVIIGETRV
jgi:hypothetical protein